MILVQVFRTNKSSKLIPFIREFAI